ncbi:MAG: hypothetical protein M9894_34710 [Planctomycetes bacterium]|nr:hypothetical protein [Planctomycetota bacterium]
MAFPGVAAAQTPPGADDGPPFRVPSDQVDDELDRSLRQEFDEDHPAPPPLGEPPPPPAAKDDDRLRLRLGGFAAHYHAQLQSVRVSYREGLSGGQEVRLDKHDAVADFDPANTQLYRAWFDIGRHVSITGGFWRGVFRSSDHASTESFTFGRTTFLQGERIGTRVEAMTADLDLVLKPVNNRWFEMGLHLGARYMYWETQLTSRADGARQERSRIEAAVPVVGASLAFRPLRWFELFARARVGYLEYDRPSRRDDFGSLDAKAKEARTAEIDLGMKFVFKETIGVIAGYRLDHLRLEREVEERTEGARGTVHGLYAGLILEF